MAMTVKWHGAKAKIAAKKGAGRGLKQAADYVLARSQDATPHVSGDLKGSGKASVDTGALRAAVSYGFGATAGYAAPIHEDMSDSHPTGSSKYLEMPLNAARGEVRSIIAREIKQELGS